MGDDGIDGTDLIDGIELALVVERTLVWPIDIGGKGSVWFLEMEVRRVHSTGAVDRGCTSHTENGVSAGFDHGIVG